jgi:hypothetical protein
MEARYRSDLIRYGLLNCVLDWVDSVKARSNFASNAAQIDGSRQSPEVVIVPVESLAVDNDVVTRHQRRHGGY